MIFSCNSGGGLKRTWRYDRLTFAPSYCEQITDSTPCAIDARRKIAHGVIMARDDPMMRFRAPADLKALIEEAAAKNGRSLNAEIVHRLERSLEDEAIESDSLDMTLRASELYKNAYDLHNLILRTHDDILKSTLAKTRDELIRQFEQIMQKSGYSDKIGKYPWE